MLNLRERVAEAHAVTPTCNAGADQPFHCHSLTCRGRAFLPPRPADEMTAALVDLFEHAMAQPTIETKLGALEGGIEGILLARCGMTAAAVAAIAGGVR